MKILIITIVLLQLVWLFTYFKNQKKLTLSQTISTAELKEKIGKEMDVQLVDIRTSFEYNRGHIKSARNIDYMGRGFREKFNSYDKNKPLYLYCRSGNRSGKAVQFLVQAGFTKVFDLQGGILEWNKYKQKSSSIIY
jgi:rhodanese-related sulfurtransferase